MKYCLITILCLFSSLNTLASEKNYRLQEVIYSKEHSLNGYLAIPEGKGPFPAVIYHHGGLGNQIGGNPKDTSIALARAGYVGFSPLRRKTRPMPDAIEDAQAAMAFLRTLEDVNQERLGIIGFSRGGHIAFYNGANNPNVKTIVIMACAPGRSNKSEFFSKVKQVKAPTLLLVAENDNVRRDDLVALIKNIEQVLHGEGNNAKLIVYPPYESDGHRMFFEIGDYWKDVVMFLDENIWK
ncbi:MAG: dienelactone hydrolase family protein [Acidobacteriota bacterium]|nr:dienelactone hydrolase family protein [Acidobacteriota bacterium]